MPGDVPEAQQAPLVTASFPPSAVSAQQSNVCSLRYADLAAVLCCAAAEGLMLPLENHGVKCMSMGFFMKVCVLRGLGEIVRVHGWAL